jgi:hypothetical protein
MPVSVVRCPRSFAIDPTSGWLVRNNWLTSNFDEWPDIFPAVHYCLPLQAQFYGFIPALDENGEKATAFWPQLLRKKHGSI